MCLKICVLKILQDILCCQAALSSSLSTQIFYPQKQVHYLKREFTNKEEFYNYFPISKLHGLLKCHLNASFKIMFPLCSILRNVGKDAIVLDRETAATFGRQKEVSSGVCLIHFISWSAQYCSNAEQDSQSAVAVSSHRLPYHCHLANLQSFHVLLQLANHNYSGSSVCGKCQIPCCDFLQLEQVKIMFVVCSWEATPLYLKAVRFHKLLEQITWNKENMALRSMCSTPPHNI